MAILMTWLDSTPVLNCVTIVCFQITSSVVSYDHPNSLLWYTIITLLRYLCVSKWELKEVPGMVKWVTQFWYTPAQENNTMNRCGLRGRTPTKLAHVKLLLTKHYFCVPGGHMRMSPCIPRSENQTQETQESLDRCRARQWHSLYLAVKYCSLRLCKFAPGRRFLHKQRH